MRILAYRPDYRRLNEDRFGKVQLLGDRLHRLVAQTVAIEDDGQRIARQPAVGEHVIDAVAARHIGLLVSVLVPPTCPTAEASARR
jgi:hypothetical protein